jgi:hypothetical protein
LLPLRWPLVAKKKKPSLLPHRRLPLHRPPRPRRLLKPPRTLLPALPLLHLALLLPLPALLLPRQALRMPLAKLPRLPPLLPLR